MSHTWDVQDMEEASQYDSQENKYFGRNGTFKIFINMNILIFLRKENNLIPSWLIGIHEL